MGVRSLEWQVRRKDLNRSRKWKISDLSINLSVSDIKQNTFLFNLALITLSFPPASYLFSYMIEINFVFKRSTQQESAADGMLVKTLGSL